MTVALGVSSAGVTLVSAGVFSALGYAGYRLQRRRQRKCCNATAAGAAAEDAVTDRTSTEDNAGEPTAADDVERARSGCNCQPDEGTSSQSKQIHQRMDAVDVASPIGGSDVAVHLDSESERL
jgi:hypothetical protein